VESQAADVFAMSLQVAVADQLVRVDKLDNAAFT
jgi:hypothetical protein